MIPSFSTNPEVILMRPLFARLVLMACMLTAVIGCSNDTTSPALNNSNESSLRDGTGDAQQPPVHGGTIAGRVFNDANGSGDLDVGETGVGGVTVTLKRVATGSTASFGTQRVVRTNDDGRYTFERLSAGTYELSVSPSSRISSAPNELTVVLTETNGVVSDVLDADLGVVATDDGDDQGDDVDRLVVGAFIRVRGDYFPDSQVLLASDWAVNDCHGEVACGLGRLRGPITFIDDRTNSFAVMGTLMRAGEETFPLYAQLGQRAEVLLHDAGVGDDFIADLVRPWFSLQDEIHGRIEEVSVRDNTARLVVLDTVVLIVGIDTGND